MITLYAATSNPGKLREFALAARPANIEVLPLPGLDAFPEPAEEAATFAGNADLKAVFYSNAAPSRLVFADDSGLEVDALGDRPGVYSARFADQLNFQSDTARSRDERNLECLLSVMHELELAAGGAALTRGARFVCALSLARDGQILLRSEGTVEGDILDTPRGDGGFGYDPLFVLRNRGLTLAELPPEQKWAVSHRGNAFRALLTLLKDGTSDH